jgi:hypothetical protein
LLALRAPLTAGGTSSAPKVGIEGKRLAGRLLGALALGALAAPTAALLPLLDAKTPAPVEWNARQGGKLMPASRRTEEVFLAARDRRPDPATSHSLGQRPQARADLAHRQRAAWAERVCSAPAR